MTIHCNHTPHYADFIQLNEAWISHYFQIEESDRKLAANVQKVTDNGGYIFSLTVENEVVGVCALFNEGNGVYELARMAVAEHSKGKGYGDVLIGAALEKLSQIGASKVTLLSNTLLKAAIGLYRKHGFITTQEGPHPDYARTNIVMCKDVS